VRGRRHALSAIAHYLNQRKEERRDDLTSPKPRHQNGHLAGEGSRGKIDENLPESGRGFLATEKKLSRRTIKKADFYRARCRVSEGGKVRGKWPKRGKGRWGKGGRARGSVRGEGKGHRVVTV